MDTQPINGTHSVPSKKGYGVLLNSFANLGTLKTSKMSHSPRSGTSTLEKVYRGTPGRSLRPGTSFGVCKQALSQQCSFVNIQSRFVISHCFGRIRDTQCVMSRIIPSDPVTSRVPMTLFSSKAAEAGGGGKRGGGGV